MKYLKTFEEFVNEKHSINGTAAEPSLNWMQDEAHLNDSILNEGGMDELDALAQDSKDLESFKREALKEYPKFKGKKGTDEWLEGIYKMANESVNEDSNFDYHIDTIKRAEDYLALNGMESVGEIKVFVNNYLSDREIRPDDEKLITSLEFFKNRLGEKPNPKSTKLGKYLVKNKLAESVNEAKSKLSGQLAGDSAEHIADELSYYVSIIPSNETGYNKKTVFKVKSPKKSVMVVKMLNDIYGIKSKIDFKSFYPNDVVVFDNEQIIK
jgi:hypothetical protein